MKKRLHLLCLFFATPLFLSAQVLQVSGLLCQFKSDPAGIEQPAPNLGWVLQSAQRGTLQTACRVLVADNEASLNNNIGNVWDSGITHTDNSLQFVYAGKPLRAATTYYWKVMVWDNHGNASGWSQTAHWQSGLFTAADWQGAQWIAYTKLDSANALGDKAGPPNDTLPLLRKNFLIKKPVKSATAYICGLGQFEASINGQKLSDDYLDPAWTDYKKQAIYVPFDISANLKAGANTIGIMLGNGFFYTPRGRYLKLRAIYGHPELKCLIRIQYQDGTWQNMVSDATWQAAPSPIVFSSIYGGEDYDARLAQNGWDTPTFKAKNWRNAIVVNGPPVLNAQMADPVKIMDSFSPKKISQPKPGIWVYDMGQNAAGIAQITVSGAAGAAVRITPAELINDDGLVSQQATGRPYFCTYILKGGNSNKPETWHPRFTYYGFRYIQIEGAVPAGEPNPGNLPVLSDVKELHMRNSAATVGSFSCSNDLFNRTFSLINWAIKSNMMSLFTDCPHREKLGWLEQDHLMANSIRYNYNVANLFAQQINDIKAAQLPNGMIPDISPEFTIFSGGFRDSPEWGSTGVLLPWYSYQWYGDKDILVNSYDMMKRYVAYLQSRAQNNIIDFGLGDWYDIGPKNPGPAQLTPKALTATAYYYYDLSILSKTATLLGKTTDASQFDALAAAVKTSYNQKFFNAQTYQYATGSQAANAVSVYMGLVEPQNTDSVVNNMVKDVRNHQNGITAGDIGFRYLLRVLANAGRSDVIFDMNNRDDVPGYGFQLAHGATSLTESWQAYRFVSNNHLMLGHLMEWFYADLAGIRQSDSLTASKQIVIHPEPVGNVTFAKASYQSNYGIIKTNWTKTAHSFELKVSIPSNTTAIIELPAAATSSVTEGGQDVHSLAGIRDAGFGHGRKKLLIGSGDYDFVVQ